MMTSQTQPVTAWYRYDKQKDLFFFNHIENGPTENDKPADPFNRGWSRAKWQRQAAQLIPNPGQAPSLRNLQGKTLPATCSEATLAS